MRIENPGATLNSHPAHAPGADARNGITPVGKTGLAGRQLARAGCAADLEASSYRNSNASHDAPSLHGVRAIRIPSASAGHVAPGSLLAVRASLRVASRRFFPTDALLVPALRPAEARLAQSVPRVRRLSRIFPAPHNRQFRSAKSN